MGAVRIAQTNGSRILTYHIDRPFPIKLWKKMARGAPTESQKSYRCCRFFAVDSSANTGGEAKVIDRQTLMQPPKTTINPRGIRNNTNLPLEDNARMVKRLSGRDTVDRVHGGHKPRLSISFRADDKIEG